MFEFDGVVFFFFQAEDGIRDFHVTGVQTCALPICMEDKLDRRLGDVETKVDRRLDGLDGRLLLQQQSAGQTATQIAEKLERVQGATAQVLARANDLARLEQALRPPKARGG